MTTLRVRTKTVPETLRLGQRLGRLLRGLDVVCLRGTLGSGKTTLTGGIARGAGSRQRVMSPTFSLVRVYRGRKIDLNHVDLYRVAKDDTGDIGLEDYLRDARAACVIEWPEAAEPFLPEDRVEVRLAHRTDGREFCFKPTGPRSRDILERLGKICH